MPAVAFYGTMRHQGYYLERTGRERADSLRININHRFARADRLLSYLPSSRTGSNCELTPRGRRTKRFSSDFSVLLFLHLDPKEKRKEFRENHRAGARVE